MNCTEIDNLALLRRSNEASAQEIAELEEHLLSCPECRNKVSQTEETLRIYHQHKVPQSPALPAGVRSRILSTINNRKPNSTRKIFALRIPMFAAALAVAASVLFIFLIVIPGKVNQNGSANYGTYSYIFEDVKSQELVSQAQDSIESINTYMALIGQPVSNQDESIIDEGADSFAPMLDIINELANELEEIETIWNTEQTI